MILSYRNITQHKQYLNIDITWVSQTRVLEKHDILTQDKDGKQQYLNTIDKHDIQQINSK